MFGIGRPIVARANLIDWAGWLQWTKNAFRSGRLGKYWKEAEMQAWVDPAFRDFANREILGSTVS